MKRLFIIAAALVVASAAHAKTIKASEGTFVALPISVRTTTIAGEAAYGMQWHYSSSSCRQQLSVHHRITVTGCEDGFGNVTVVAAGGQDTLPWALGGPTNLDGITAHTCMPGLAMRNEQQAST